MENIKDQTLSLHTLKSPKIELYDSFQWSETKKSGAKIRSDENKIYIDYYLNNGSKIFGHNSGKVDKINLDTPEKSKLIKTPEQFQPFFTNNFDINNLIPYDSELKAFQSAVQIARSITNKKRIITFTPYDKSKIDHSENNAKNDNLIFELPYNNEEVVFDIFLKFKDDIAAVIVEPVSIKNGIIYPNENYLNFLRSITTQFNSILIFDESISGFRKKNSFDQAKRLLNPDMSIYGNITDGEYSLYFLSINTNSIEYHIPDQQLERQNKILTLVKKINTPLFLETLNHKSRDFIFCLEEITKNKGIIVNSYNSIFSFHYIDGSLTSTNNYNFQYQKRKEHFLRKCFENGIYFTRKKSGVNFLSSAHLPVDLTKTLDVVYHVLKAI